MKQVFQGIIQFFTGIFTGDWKKALDGLTQFLYSNTPIAITAAIASITSPIGLVRNVKAAPNAVVTAVPTVHIAFHAVIAEKALDGLKNIFSGAFKALSSLAMAPLNALNVCRCL